VVRTVHEAVDAALDGGLPPPKSKAARSSDPPTGEMRP
jgi:hypothetical protein